MKKTFIVMGISALLLGLPLSVSADTSIMKLREVDKDARWVSNTNLLGMPGYEGSALQTVEGQNITGNLYGNRFEYSKGYITAYENKEGLNTEGVLSLGGKTMVPFQYGEIDMQNPHWCVALVLEEATSDNYDYTSLSSEDTYYLINQADIYYLDGETANCVASLGRNQYIESEAFGSYINIKDRDTNVISTYDSSFNQVATDLRNIYDAPEGYGDVIIYEENGRRGLKDKEGNVIMEPSFQYITDDFRGHCTTVTSDGKDGLIDDQGNVLVPAEYERVMSVYTSYLPTDAPQQGGYVAAGYVAVKQDGKIGFVKAGGDVTFAPKYSDDIIELNGASGVLTDLEGNTILIAADGQETTLPKYDNLGACDHCSGILYRTRNEEGKVGLIDWHGNEILPCEYSELTISGDGNYLLLGTDYSSPKELYQINYDIDTSAPAAAGGETGATAGGAAAGSEGEAAPAEAQTEAAPTDAAQTPAGSESAGSVALLLDSAITVMGGVTDGNYQSVIAVLESAETLIAPDRTDVTALIDSAIALLDTGVGGDAVTTLITNAKNLL